MQLLVHFSCLSSTLLVALGTCLLLTSPEPAPEDGCSAVLKGAYDIFQYETDQSLQSTLTTWLYTSTRKEMQDKLDLGLDVIVPTEVGPVPLSGTLSNEQWERFESVRSSGLIKTLNRQEVTRMFVQKPNENAIDKWAACMDGRKTGLIEDDDSGDSAYHLTLQYVKARGGANSVRVTEVFVNRVKQKLGTAAFPSKYIAHDPQRGNTFEFNINRLARENTIVIRTSAGDVRRILPQLKVPERSIFRLTVIVDAIVPGSWSPSGRKFDPYIVGYGVVEAAPVGTLAPFFPQNATIPINLVWRSLVTDKHADLDFKGTLEGIGPRGLGRIIITDLAKVGPGFHQGESDYLLGGFGNFQPGVSGKIKYRYSIDQ